MSGLTRDGTAEPVCEINYHNVAMKYQYLVASLHTAGLLFPGATASFQLYYTTVSILGEQMFLCCHAVCCV